MHAGSPFRGSGKDLGYYRHREQQQQRLMPQSGDWGTTPRFQNVTTRNENRASMRQSRVERYPNKRLSQRHGDSYRSHMRGHGSESNQIHHKEDGERFGWQIENDRNSDRSWGETRDQGFAKDKNQEYKNYNRGDVPRHNQDYDFNPNGDQRYQSRSRDGNYFDQYYTSDRYVNQHDKPQIRELGYFNEDCKTLNNYKSKQSPLIQCEDSRYGNAGHRHCNSQPKHEDFSHGNEDFARNTNEVLMPCNDENYGHNEGDQDYQCEDFYYDYNIGNKDYSQGVHCDSRVGAESHDVYGNQGYENGNQDSMYLHCNAPGNKMMRRRYQNQRTPKSFDFNDGSSHSAGRETFDPRCAVAELGSDTCSYRRDSNNTTSAGHTFRGGKTRKRGRGGGGRPWKDRYQVQFPKMLDMYIDPGSPAGNTLERVRGRGSSFIPDMERRALDYGKSDAEKREDGSKWMIGFRDSHDEHQANFDDSGIKKFGKKRKDLHDREHDVKAFEGRPGKHQKVHKKGREGGGVLNLAKSTQPSNSVGTALTQKKSAGGEVLKGREGGGILNWAKSVPLSSSASTAPTQMQSARNEVLLGSYLDDTDDIDPYADYMNPGEKSKEKVKKEMNVCGRKNGNASSHFGWPQSASLRGHTVSAQKAVTGKDILFTSSSGVGLSSLSDVVRSARARLLVTPISAELEVPAEDSMTMQVEHWKKWALPSVSLTNPITAVECSLTTFKVRFLQLHYSHQPLTRCDKYCVFTGTLRLSKATESEANDGIFLARGLGLSPKTAKLDAYEKAYTLVMGSTVTEILSQKDCGNEVLSQEIANLHDDNQTAFMALLKRTITAEGHKLRALVNASTKWPNADDNEESTAQVQLVKQPDSDCKPSVLLEAHENASRITKEAFNEKLIMLKKLLETECVSKFHVVPKMDHLAFRANLHVLNVYRFEHVPLSRDGAETPLFCEIYFENEYVIQGETTSKLEDAVHTAYMRLMDRLLTEPVDSMTSCSSVWHPHIVNDPDVWKVVLKTPVEKPDYWLTTNQAEIKKTMKCSPDLLVPVKDFVLLEVEGTATSDDEAFDMLTLCATQHCMLLECELCHNDDNTFRCWISLQGKLVAAKSGASQSDAQKICAKAAVKKLAKSHDVISVSAYVKGPVYTRNHLLEAAKKAKEFGMQPLKCCPKTNDSRVIARTLDLFVDEEEEEIEAHIPWIGKALAHLIFKHITKITLGDVRIAISDMPKSMKDVVTLVGTKMGLHNAGTDSQSHHTIWRRAVTPVEVSKIVSANFGKSGRYSMKKCFRPWPPYVLESFRKEIVERYTRLYEDLLKEEHCDQTIPHTCMSHAAV